MIDFYQTNNMDFSQKLLNDFIQQNLKQQYGLQTPINQSLPMNQSVSTTVGSINTSSFPKISFFDTGNSRVYYGVNEDFLKTIGVENYKRVTVNGQDYFVVDKPWLQKNLPLLKIGFNTLLGLGQLGLGFASFNLAKQNIKRQNALLDEQLRQLKEKYNDNKKARKQIEAQYFA